MHAAVKWLHSYLRCICICPICFIACSFYKLMINQPNCRWWLYSSSYSGTEPDASFTSFFGDFGVVHRFISNKPNKSPVTNMNIISVMQILVETPTWRQKEGGYQNLKLLYNIMYVVEKEFHSYMQIQYSQTCTQPVAIFIQFSDIKELSLVKCLKHYSYSYFALHIP